MTSLSTPSLIALAGPNGAGKTTAGSILLRDTLGVTEFVNADLIAQGISPFAPEAAAVTAGRIMLARLHDLANRRTTFAFETTLAGRAYVPWIRNLLDEGYRFHLVFLWLPSAELAIHRVADRVRQGGHNISKEIVRRRYHRGLENLRRLYLPLATTWSIYDNSGSFSPIKIATGAQGAEPKIFDWSKWRTISEGGEV